MSRHPIALTAALCLVLALTIAIATANVAQAATLSRDIGPFAARMKATSLGYKASEGGGGSLTTEWVPGNLGDTWAEGEWVPYQLVIENIEQGLTGLDSIVVSFDFTRPHGGGNYFRFVDLIRGLQIGTVQLDNTQGWVGPGGNAMPVGTRAELEAAQNDPNEYVWSGFTPLNLPDEQVNRTLDGGLDVPPGEDLHIFKIYKADLVNAGIDTSATTVVVYYQLHESRTFVWGNQLQAGYDASPTDMWGGYLYGTDGWPTAGPMMGSGYVPGASGHVRLEYPGGGQEVPIPIPEPQLGSVSGRKWHDVNENGLPDGEPGVSGWEIHVSGNIEGIDFATSTLTDVGGDYVFPNLTTGTWIIKEDSLRDVPPETAYFQTYPTVGVSHGQGQGIPVSPPPADVAGVGWSVVLTADNSEQDNMNFGNGRCEMMVICPCPVGINCTTTPDPRHTGNPIVEGNCPPFDISYEDSIIPGACPQEYTIQRTWTISDAAGNLEICVQMINVVDGEAPVLTCADDKRVYCNEPVVFDEPDVSDNCDPNPTVEIISTDSVPGPGPGEITHTRCWIAYDACGNTSSPCCQNIVEVDEEPPTLTCADDKRIGCNEPVVFDEPDVSDDCDPNPTVEIISTDVVAGPGPCDESNIRCWIAYDMSGNTSEPCCQTIIRMVDTEAPVLTPAPDGQVGCNQPVVFTDPQVTDNCDPEPTVEIFSTDVVPGPEPCEETHTRCWIAYDECNNTSEPACQNIVRMVDEESPVLTCAPDAVIPCNQPVVFTDPQVTDNCDIDPTVEVVSTNSVPGPGPGQVTHTRCWIAHDDCGNTSGPCCQNITETDEEPPTLTCAVDKTIGCNQAVVFDEPEVTDNCDPEPTVEIISTDVVPGPGLCEETHTRCWIAYDVSGNTSEPCCQNIVRMVDEESPVLIPAPDGEVPCNEEVVFTGPDVSDNCDSEPTVEIFSTDVVPGPGECEYTHTRCWIAYDDCGNASDVVCQAIVTMVDTIPPVIICGPDKTIEYNEPVIFDEPVMSDNCGLQPESNSQPAASPVVLDNGETVHERCWGVADVCGNFSECCQRITQKAPPPPYCTFMCWDWAADCLDGANRDMSSLPACIRDDHFYDLFPEGVRVGVEGSGTYTALWTSPRAIEEFACGYGIPKVLTRDHVDPKRYELRGILAGEILGLRLNREFSCGGYLSDLGFPAFESCYGNYVISDSVLYFGGLTVDEFLAIADQAVGGNTGALLPYGANIDHLWATAAYLNWLFSDCGGQATKASEPPMLIGSQGDEDTSEQLSVPAPDVFRVTLQPNPLKGSTTINLALPVSGKVAVEIYDIQGRKVVTLLNRDKTAGYHSITWNGSDASGAPIASGVYFCRVTIGDQTGIMEKLIKL